MIAEGLIIALSMLRIIVSSAYKGPMATALVGTVRCAGKPTVNPDTLGSQRFTMSLETATRFQRFLQG